VALAAPVTVVGPFSTTSTILYSAPTTYQRDLVLTNQGTATVYVGSFTAVTSATGTAIPAGQSLIMQGPVTSGNFVWGITSAGTATMQVGLASVYSVI
jgi:hypothetical protein